MATRESIKDYLHLYLGCEVAIEGQPNAIMSAYGIRNNELVIVRWGDEWSYAGTEEIKPILRPLSSMTEGEQGEMEFTQETVRLQGYPHIKLGVDSAETFKYLLSKHFDIFNLIEKGLAIDSTTIKTPQP